MSGLGDGTDDSLYELVGHHHLDLEHPHRLVQILSRVYRLGLTHDHDGQVADVMQRIQHGVELERLDNCFDFLHRSS